MTERTNEWGRSASDAPSSWLGATPGLVLGDHFRLAECLKRREQSETWRAVDVRNGSPAVVKLVSSEVVSSAVRLRLEHEAAVLARLDVAAKPLATGTEGPVVYLVQSFVSGDTLQQRLAAGALPVESTVRIGIEVLTTLASVHQHQVVHCDVKPANIVVHGGDPPDRAALVDFGLACSAWLERTLRDELVGTARYLAPEVAGLVDAEVDERSDLYSVGAVLYECLAGRPPFEGATVGEVLRAHAGSEAPSLRRVRGGVPRALEEVVHRLLAKDPAERYQSAAAASSDLQAIADGLGSGMVDPPVVVGATDRRRSLAQAAFVGRTEELGVVQRAIAGPGGGIVLVESESGGGKTRLLDELCLRLGPEVLVLRGQGADQVALQPFHLLDGVAGALSLACNDMPSLAGDMVERLGSWADAAAAALPALGDVVGAAPGHGPEAHGQARTVAALCALLDAIGTGDRRVVIVLDDVQWADAMTLRLLTEWSEPGRRSGIDAARGDDGASHAGGNNGGGGGGSNGGGGLLTVVAAFRTEEVGEDHPLRALRPQAHVVLAPFGGDDVAAVCESMAGPLPAAATEAVASLAEGSPFMVEAVLSGLVEAGVLELGPDGWRLDEQALAGAQTSRRAGLFLARRLDRLPASARRLLSAGAVLGKVFDLDTAVQVAALDAAPAGGALQAARRMRVVWVDEPSGRCSFAHDKLREALLEQLGPEARAQLHHRAARTIAATGQAPAFELAYHFDAAGMPDAAFPHACEAAAAARSRHALEVSIAQYRIAERGAAARDRRQQRAVHEGLGEVLSLAGDYHEAEQHLQQALDLADDAVERASLEGKLGEVAFRRGDQAAARRFVEGALRQLGRRVPRSTAGFVLGTMWELVVQGLHTLVPGRLGRRRLEEAGAALLAARLCSRLAYVFWFSRGRFPCAWAHLRAMNAAERYPLTPELAQAWSEHAPVATMVPWFARGLTYADRSHDARVALEDRWGQGQSLGFRGVVLYAASRWRECIDACRQTVELLATTGDRWEENTATWHIAFCHYRLGELAEAVQVARRVYARASAIGDQTARGIALAVWSRAALGDVPADLLAAELALDTNDAQTAVEVRVGEAVRLLAAGEPQAACERLDEALATVRSVGLRQEYVIPAFVWSATARRCMVEALPTVAGRRRRVALRAARRGARKAVRKARLYRNNLPHALREAGLVAALSGRERRARHLLERSAAIASLQGAAHELRQTELARTAVGASPTAESASEQSSLVGPAAGETPPGDTGASDAGAGDAGAGDAGAAEDARTTGARTGDATSSDARAEGEDRAWTLSLADRFSTLLEVGRLISSASSPEAVHQAVQQGALQLLRGEHCHVVELPEGSALPGASATEPGVPLDDVSRGLLAQALRAGRPVVADMSLAGDPSESLVLSGARSALAAPIFCESRPAACLFVVSRRMPGLFGDHEVQLASFIATLAGAVLEHVAGSEARFRSLVHNASDVITILDDHGRVTYQSDSVRRVFGLDPVTMVGRPFAEWVHPDDAGAVMAALAHGRRHDGPVPDDGAAHRGGPIPDRCRVRDVNGSWRHAETVITDLLGDPGVRGVVLNIRDVTEQVALERQLWHRAWHDAVTGLANRTLFLDRVEHARARYSRQSASFAVIFLDLDDFKSVNDTLGHPTGDRFLQAVAGRLTACVRPEDTVARFGGDEFAILLEDADPDRARLVCERLLRALAAPVDMLGHQLEAHASLGVVVGGAEVRAEDLMAAADTALYVAKARGKRRFEIFEPSMRAAAVARAELRADLQHALVRSELRLVYQPIVAIATEEVTGFEALLRWAHPQRGLLLPDEFVGLAEESGGIVAIGAWVLAAACMQARAWNDATGRPLSMAVNVSARQLLHPRLVDEVRAAVGEAGIDPELLVLEITESATVQDTEAVAAKLTALKRLGVQLAVDDFGTGYSALGYLRRLPVDVLKIDRSFVTGLAHSNEDAAIVETVITLAEAFRLDTVAEGVERVDQLEILARLGCVHAQGFHWKRPAPAEELTDWVLQAAPGGRSPV